MLAREGAPESSEKLSVCGGDSGSVALAVNMSAVPSSTVLPPIDASTGAVLAPSAMAQSLNEVMPVAWMLVAVRVPAATVLHAPPANFWILNALVLAPASTSPASQLNTALALVNPMPLFESV